MGKSTILRVLEILERNGGYMSRDDFKRAALIEIGVDRRTIKRLNTILREMDGFRLIKITKKGIRLLENGRHHISKG